ncbi:MAG: AraC family transcriptional regulator [Hyphomicrobiales bacterium]|nr:AraC family transcriptional regulator [Hyphomicrobiales bacterium]MBV8827453.1 AraC family transcriptional regulator [Hyphomicrobiales bacterium]
MTSSHQGTRITASGGRVPPGGTLSAPTHVTTDVFPPAKRLAMWREIYGRNIGKFDIEPIGDAPFHADVTFRLLPGLGLATGARSDAHYRMTRELAARSADNVIFAMVTQGLGIVSQFGREVKVQSGGAVMLSASEPSVCTLLSHGRFLTLSIPREAVAPLVPDLGAAFVRAVPEKTEALSLLMSYLGILQDTIAFSSTELAGRVVAHFIDLAVLAVGPTQDSEWIARRRGRRAARLNSMKVEIERHLSREGFSVVDLAGQHRVTPRYVQMLFETEGKTFSQYLIERRLARAYRLLADPGCGHLTISAIAFEVGFANLSYFNRVFRRRYGATPSDIRAAAGPRDER